MATLPSTPTLWVIEYSRSRWPREGHMLAVAVSSSAARHAARKLAYDRHLDNAELFEATKVNLASLVGRAFDDLGSLAIAVSAAEAGEAATPVDPDVTHRYGRPVLELLAVLNRDGGHRVAEVGVDQAAAEALAEVQAMRQKLATIPPVVK